MCINRSPRAPAIAAIILLASSAIAGAQGTDGGTGAAVFKKCSACHLVGSNAKHAVGPALNNIVGRRAGSSEGYAYSDNMRELGQSGLVWSEDQLSRYLENPKAVVPRGKMVFPGIPIAQDRTDLISYLKAFSAP